MSDVDHTPSDQQLPPARPTPDGESSIAMPAAAAAVAATPPAPASNGSDRDAADSDTHSSPLKLYALVALAYAQRLHDTEERLAAVEEQARTANDGQQVLAAALAGVRARLATLEERPRQPQEPRDTQERRGTNRRNLDAVWIAEERRRVDRRAQQDRERFEETVMGQYVPPAPALVPPSTDTDARADATPAPPSLAPPTVKENGDSQAADERRVGEAHRRHPSLLARILRYLR